jgi:hypothetical protein
MSRLWRIWPTLVILAIISPAVLQHVRITQHLGALLPAGNSNFEQIANFDNGIKVFNVRARTFADGSLDEKVKAENSLIVATKNGEILQWQINGNTAIATNLRNTAGRIAIVAPNEISKVSPQSNASINGIMVLKE